MKTETEHNGQFTNDKIAKLSKAPALMSLAESANFVEFEALNKKLEKEKYEYQPKIWKWEIINYVFLSDEFNYTYLYIKEKKTNKLYKFMASIHIDEIIYNEAENKIEYPIEDRTDIPANTKKLVEAINSIDFFKNNFNIAQGSPSNKETANTIILENKTTSNNYAIDVEHYDSGIQLFNYFKLIGENPFSNPISDLIQNINSQDINLRVQNYNWKENYIPDLTLNLTDQKKRYETFVANNTRIILEDRVTKTRYSFNGTQSEKNINNATFFVSENPLETIQNIRECLLLNSFVNNNFNVNVDYNHDKQSFTNTLKLTPRDTNNIKDCNLSTANPRCILATGQIREMTTDSISNGSADANIEIEIYTDTGALMEKEIPLDKSMGNYMTTLRKSYHGIPLWFDLNALMANKSTFKDDFLHKDSWQNAGTATDYRFVAKRFNGINREPFYLSDIMYCITGYNRNLDENNLEEYVYNVQKQETENNVNKTIVKPLTTQPPLTHVEKQTHYFNFILKDENRRTETNKDISLIYRLYTQSKELIYTGESDGKNKRHSTSRANLTVVNTIKLDIDSVIKDYQKRLGSKAKTVGYVEVTLCHTINKEDETVDLESEKISYQILPKCLHKVNDFAFLNSLGGWSSFNFGGEEKTNFKASSTNIFKTQTPHYISSSQIESVYGQDVSEQFSVKTTPINATTLEWLKEMSASMAVYELKTKRYIIVDELNIQPNTKDELFVVEMKYRYSDAYNGRIK